MIPHGPNRLVHALRGRALVGAMSLMLGCSQSGKERTDAAAAPALVGAWRADLQFTDGAFASIKDLEFLYVFNQGGTLTESSNYDGAPPVPPAYGIWRQVGPGEFEAKYVFYTTRAPRAFTDLTGGGGWLPAGHGEFMERIRLSGDGNGFESTIRYEVFDTAGTSVAGGGTATGHGHRIAFPPAP